MKQHQDEHLYRLIHCVSDGVHFTDTRGLETDNSYSPTRCTGMGKRALCIRLGFLLVIFTHEIAICSFFKFVIDGFDLKQGAVNEVGGIKIK